jgi:hypothetical protein
VAEYKPPDKNDSKQKEQQEEKTSEPSLEEQPKAQEEGEEDKPARPIIILEERDIPFEEERPPNFSPHFRVKVKRVRRHEKPRVVTE